MNLFCSLSNTVEAIRWWPPTNPEHIAIDGVEPTTSCENPTDFYLKESGDFISPGDWIIRLSNGKREVCPQNVFPAKYVPFKKQVTVSAVVLFDHLGAVFLQRRPEGAIRSGYWEFPGGKVEPGESLEETLQREIKEELNFDISKESPFPITFLEWVYPDAGCVIHLYGLKINQIDLQKVIPPECQYSFVPEWLLKNVHNLLPSNKKMLDLVCNAVQSKLK